MRLSELIDRLSEIASTTDGDPEVRLAHQPRWPLAFGIGDVVMPDPKDPDPDRDPDATPRRDDTPPPDPIVWIAEGDSFDYVPGFVSRALGWR